MRLNIEAIREAFETPFDHDKPRSEWTEKEVQTYRKVMKEYLSAMESGRPRNKWGGIMEAKPTKDPRGCCANHSKGQFAEPYISGA